VQFSPDGEWFWDGAQWRPAYSPDRLWRWDGRQWVPARPPAQSWHYEATPWTRRLQVLLVTVMAAGVVLAFALVPLMVLPVIQQTFDGILATQPTDPNVDPQQLRSIMTATLYSSLAIGAVLGAAMFAVLVIGIVRLWRWVYWYLAVTYLLALLGIPQNLVYATGVGPLRLPATLLLFTVPLALAQGALGVLMIVLYRRYGTWARRRVQG
jgi:hypothetical protein